MRRTGVVLAVVLAAGPAAGNTAPGDTALAQCEALAGLRIPATAIGLPTGGAVVDSAVRVAESARGTDKEGEAVLPIGAHCRVQGRIAPAGQRADPIRFNLNLPLQWNGRALQSGGGGGGGYVITAPGNKGSGRLDPEPLDQPYRLTRGYIVFGSDEGHGPRGFGHFQEPEALANAAGDFIKKTRDVALVIIRAAYSRAPDRLYLTGESRGGAEVMRAAQRYGADYDGVVATSPNIATLPAQLADNRIRSALVDGFLDKAAIKLVADQTRAACDTADGLRDGVIARYLACKVDVARLRCPDGKPGTGCLSDPQIRSVRAIREPWIPPAGVTFANGLTRFPGYGVTGDEDGPAYQWDFYSVGKRPPSHPLPPGPGLEPGVGGMPTVGMIFARHAIGNDPALDPYDFDPGQYPARIRQLSDLYEATDPDLTAFARHGGKMIVLQPSADNAVSVAVVAGYYRAVQARMGARAANIMRLYVSPGGGHNVVGTSQTDLISLLEAWVERGVAPPPSIPVEDVDPATLKVRRAMIACSYPAYTEYRGAGGPDASSSFRCRGRPDPLAGSPR